MGYTLISLMPLNIMKIGKPSLELINSAIANWGCLCWVYVAKFKKGMWLHIPFLNLCSISYIKEYLLSKREETVLKSMQMAISLRNEIIW
ncbi:hypothetical protein HDF22_000767 [Mucilaginibacter lappiensis]|uniref:Uncharacterized protein n=1 Tax=Mucilaginibacter lappiensis TaxID=354630 RepID=A0A841J8H5_9SPHI|nr:hypothetical protein [Mucilaginibacter lappiensis]